MAPDLDAWSPAPLLTSGPVHSTAVTSAAIGKSNSMDAAAFTSDTRIVSGILDGAGGSGRSVFDLSESGWPGLLKAARGVENTVPPKGEN